MVLKSFQKLMFFVHMDIGYTKEALQMNTEHVFIF